MWISFSGFYGIADGSHPFERKRATAHFKNDARACYFPSSLA
jgi:hypothetical protein